MRHLSFIGGVLVLSSLGLLISSCEKNLDTQYTDRQETGILKDKPCKDCIGEYIGFHSGNSTLDPMNPPPIEESPFFFWRGDKYDCPNDDITLNCKQQMFNTDFSDEEFFVVTATGGFPVLNCQNGGLGVNDTYITPGETLTIELSACMAGHWMDGFNLIFNSRNGGGVIELYHAGNLVRTIPFSKQLCHPYPEMIEDRAQNYPVTWSGVANKERFTKMVIRPVDTRLLWVGHHRNLHPNDPNLPFPHFGGTWWHVTKAK